MDFEYEKKWTPGRKVYGIREKSSFIITDHRPFDAHRIFFVGLRLNLGMWDD